MHLWQALGISPGNVVAFTGGGGKTSLALRVVQELALTGRPVIFTTTTRIYPAPGMAAFYMDELGANWLEPITATLASGRPVCLGARIERETGKIVGLQPERIADLKRAIPGCVILVEADGSAGRPLKAPAPHEPVIPAIADLVIPVAGGSALGKPLVADHVHRADVLAELTGTVPGDLITPAIVATALVSPNGCVRGAPEHARVVPVLGQADLLGVEAELFDIGERLLRQVSRNVGRVVLAAPATDQPVRQVLGDVSAVVLAAGASRRFGSEKLIHPWGSTTLLEASLSALLCADLKEVVVVTGAYRVAVEQVLHDYPVRLVHNSVWATGMASSLRAGVQSLADGPGAVMICLGDQPCLPPHVIRRLVDAYRKTGAPIVAPVAGGRRCNPVLFDRTLLPELMAVTGDEGGRSVIRRHEQRMVTVDFDTPSWFDDIDTPLDLNA